MADEKPLNIAEGPVSATDALGRRGGRRDGFALVVSDGLPLRGSDDGSGIVSPAGDRNCEGFDRGLTVPPREGSATDLEVVLSR